MPEFAEYAPIEEAILASPQSTAVAQARRRKRMSRALAGDSSPVAHPLAGIPRLIDGFSKGLDEGLAIKGENERLAEEEAGIASGERDTEEFLKGVAPAQQSSAPMALGEPASKDGITASALVDYYTREHGFQPHQAAALAANAQGESNFNPRASRVVGKEDSHGLFQWNDGNNNGRWTKYVNWAHLQGRDPYDWRAQADYSVLEIPGITNQIRNARTADEANRIWVRQWERPANPDRDERTRSGYASQILGRLLGGKNAGGGFSDISGKLSDLQGSVGGDPGILAGPDDPRFRNERPPGLEAAPGNTGILAGPDDQRFRNERPSGLESAPGNTGILVGPEDIGARFRDERGGAAPMPPPRPSAADLQGNVPLPPPRPAGLEEGRSVAAPRVTPPPSDVPRAPIPASPGQRQAPPGTHWAQGPGEPLLLRDTDDARTAGLGNPFGLFGGASSFGLGGSRIPQAEAVNAVVPAAAPQSGGTEVAGPAPAAEPAQPAGAPNADRMRVLARVLQNPYASPQIKTLAMEEYKQLTQPVKPNVHLVPLGDGRMQPYDLNTQKPLGAPIGEAKPQAPLTLSPGQTLLDPKTYQPVGPAPAGYRLPDGRPADQAKPGDTVIGPDGKPFVLGPSGPTVNIDQKGEGEEAKQLGALNAKSIETMRSAGDAAPMQIAKLDLVRRLLAGVNTGAMADTKAELVRYGRAFGLSDDTLKNFAGLDPNLPQTKQAAAKIINEMVVGMIGSGGFPANNFSDADRRFLIDTFPKLSNEPSANEMAIEVIKRTELRKAEKLQAWDDYSEQMAEQGKRPNFEEFDRQFRKSIKGKDIFADLNLSGQPGTAAAPAPAKAPAGATKSGLKWSVEP